MFVYVNEHVGELLPSNVNLKCLAVVGYYIAIGKSFACGNQNSMYTSVHEHFMKYHPKDREYYSNGKLVSWASDMVFLDLPPSLGYTH